MLRRAQQNDSTMKILKLGGDGYKSTDQYDYARLGAAIGKNTYITQLIMVFINLHIETNSFFDGLRLNSSIKSLSLICDYNRIIGWRFFSQTLMSYQANNNLTSLSIGMASLDNGGERVIAAALQACTNLKSISLGICGITDEQLAPMVDAMRHISQLEELDLYDNFIGNDGCEVLSTTLLEDPNCNICKLQINRNNIRNEGVISLVNSLANNTKLKALDLNNNRIDLDLNNLPIEGSVEDDFVRLLCNTLSINDTYSSNHTLELVELDYPNRRVLVSLLELNGSTSNKSHVAMKKILRHHPDIDMEPLYDWDINGEWTLKSLPYVIDWYDKALVAVHEVDDDCSEDEEVPQMKLSAVYEFAKAMPLLFVPTSHKVKDKKRKR